MTRDELVTRLEYIQERTVVDFSVDEAARRSLDALFDALRAVATASGDACSDARRKPVADALQCAEAILSPRPPADLTEWGRALLETAARYLSDAEECWPLSRIDVFLKSGETPPERAFREAAVRELARLHGGQSEEVAPDVTRLALAAYLLDDGDLFLDLLRADAARDMRSYQRQRSDGMRGRDLGARPCELVSLHRIRAAVDGFLARRIRLRRDELMARWSAFCDACRRTLLQRDQRPDV